MNLLNVIEIYCDGFDAGDSSKSRNKALQCLSQMKEYLAGNDADLLQAINPTFIEDFCIHLFEKSDSVNPKTVYGWIDTLRRCVRAAIRKGLLPAVDVFPEVIQRLRSRYPYEQDHAEKTSNYSMTSPDFKESFERLLGIVSANHHGAKSSSKDIEIYLFGLFCFGAELKDMAEARVLPRDEEHPHPFFRLERYGVEIALTELLQQLRERHNGKRHTGEYLFKEFDGLGYEGRQEMVGKISKRIATFMKNHALKLFLSGSIMSDELAIAICRGCDKEAVIDVVRAITDRRALPVEEAERIQKAVDDRHGLLKRQWRVLCSFTPSLTADKMEERIKQLAQEADKAIEVKCYNPHRQVTRRVNGKVAIKRKSILGRYLFVQTNRRDCEVMEKNLNGAAFLRRIDKKTERAVVPDSEIMRMMAFMHDYGHDMEIVGLTEWARQQELDLSLGQRVKIQEGPYAGFEGIILDAKNSADPSGSTKIFIVKVTGLPDLAIAGNVTAKLRGLDMVAI